MSFTNYSNGITSFGLPVLPGVMGGGPRLSTPRVKLGGRHWFVDGNIGSDGVSAKSNSPLKPFLTMAKVFALVKSGDTIHCWGNIREQLTSPAGVFDVTIIGESPNTRHPDAHTTNGGYSSFRWNAPASPTASTPLLKVQQQGWAFHNVLFTGDENDSVGCVQLYRDGESGDSERDGSHAQFFGCRFAGGLYGIQASGGIARVRIHGCEFQNFSESDNYGIQTVTGAGIGTNWGWDVQGNDFRGNHNDIVAALDASKILWNHFVLTWSGETTTVSVNTSGGVSGFNVIAKNFMYAASDHNGVGARFVLGTGDSYAGNYWNDAEEYAEPAS